MIIPRRIEYEGEIRLAIFAVPAHRTTYDEKGRALVAPDSDVTPVILPEGVSVHWMPAWLRWTHAVATTFPRKLFIPRRTKHLLLETLVHECVHEIQSQWMGRVHYFATFLWQFVLAWVRYGKEWHDHHLMEREARRLAKKIIALVSAKNEREPINAERLIKAELRTHFPVGIAA